MKTAIAGLGTIGLKVAKDLHQGIPGLELSAVSSGRPEIARARLAEAGIDVPVLTNGELPGEAKIIVASTANLNYAKLARSLGRGRGLDISVVEKPFQVDKLQAALA